ncbi:anion transporter [Desulfocurvibacter africanus PCS]|uniref:Anion transporter n=1 Tax=Desulfocurvibacter africanus PCS TaxID=1262666 RepID=M5PZT6_DESAF|nr:anion transporter [Desulfocurvibacter africanus PCS]
MKDSSQGRRIGFILGPILFIAMLLLPVPEGMKPEAWKVAAITVLMAVWWITEAIPIPATSLLPIVLFPALGIMKSAQATIPYADHLIFLFMGGFFIAVTMERWNLHRRIAIHTIRLVGTSPSRMTLGFMLATGFLSMWISNTATAMMMVPIGLAVVMQATGLTSDQMRERVGGSSGEINFGKGLMLGIAYAASIGGVATIIGTPPNVIMVGMISKLYGQTISFAEWMMYGVPLSAIMLAITWFLLTKVLFKTGDLELGGGAAIIEKELRDLGPMKKEEKYIVYVGLVVSLMWIFQALIVKYLGFKMIADATIGILGALAMFAIPSDFKKGEFLLNWKTAVKIPWDVILLFGGGLAIANGFAKTDLAVWIAQQLTLLDGLSMLSFVAIVVTMTIFLTEVTSNTATATLLIPIMGASAVALGVHPYATIVGAVVAASYAFMLPVATPPNAVIFGTGCVTIPQMAKAGVWLNIIGIILITGFTAYIMPALWGVELNTLPEWANVTATSVP